MRQINKERPFFVLLDEIDCKDQQRLLMLNKIDLLDHNADILVFESECPDCISISAKSGRNVEELVERIRLMSRGESREMTVSIDISDGRALQFIESRTDVRDRRYEDTTVIYDLNIGQRQLDQLRSMGAKMKVINGESGDGERLWK